MKEAFVEYKFHQRTIELLHICNDIIDDLGSQGYRLTLRQLFYQCVSRDIIANKQSEYKRLGEIINTGRLAGVIDWDAIEDRTRNLKGIGHYIDPTDLIGSAAGAYRIDKWANQPYRVEVWVEKDALIQVIQKACNPWDVDYFSCRGYVSASEIYGASKRYIDYCREDQKVMIIHLGDHDPSGIDMTRDVTDRIEQLTKGYGYAPDISIERIALSMKQVIQYHPPPNPAKPTDSRYESYAEKYGKDCWELDALNPKVIDDLITAKIKTVLEEEPWEHMTRLEKEGRDQLAKCKAQWPEVVKFLNRKPRAKKKKTK